MLNLTVILLFTINKRNTIHLVERSVAFEQNITKDHARKQETYLGYLKLFPDISDNGFVCDLVCFEVGSHRLITPDNVGHIDKVFSFGAESQKPSVRANCLYCPDIRSGMLDRRMLWGLKISH